MLTLMGIEPGSHPVVNLEPTQRQESLRNYCNGVIYKLVSNASYTLDIYVAS